MLDVDRKPEEQAVFIPLPAITSVSTSLPTVVGHGRAKLNQRFEINLEAREWLVSSKTGSTMSEMKSYNDAGKWSSAPEAVLAWESQPSAKDSHGRSPELRVWLKAVYNEIANRNVIANRLLRGSRK